MNLEKYNKKTQGIIVVLLIIPLILSLVALLYLKIGIQGNYELEEKFSPQSNKPLFVSLILFTVGYLFFLGMIFSDNILETFNKRIHLHTR